LDPPTPDDGVVISNDGFTIAIGDGGDGVAQAAPDIPPIAPAASNDRAKARFFTAFIVPMSYFQLKIH